PLSAVQFFAIGRTAAREKQGESGKNAQRAHGKRQVSPTPRVGSRSSADLADAAGAIAKADDGESVHLRTTLAIAGRAVGIVGDGRALPPWGESVGCDRVEVARAFGDVALVKEFARGNEESGDLFEQVAGRDPPLG